MPVADIPQFDPQNDRVRWVAYFDLLGTRDRIAKGDQFGVFDAYQRAIEYFQQNRKADARVEVTWFSDTFLLTTADDSARSFAAIEQLSRLFMYFMLRDHIPLRGAIACGQMYVDHRAGILIGQAMVEAHEYGESQDWIGLLICPSAEAAMERLGLPVAARLDHAYWQPVWKLDQGPPGAPARVGACLLGRIIDDRSNLELVGELRARSYFGRSFVGQAAAIAIQFVLDNQRRTVGPVDSREAAL